VLVTVTQADGRAGVTVRDTGPGIPAGEWHRVFERFWQADGTRTGSGGAGLGLAISKHIIDQHGGSIEVRANKPTGACFVVTLPRRGPEPGDPEPGGPEPGDPEPGGPGASG
jgi:signal transduction histidine kinase